MVFPLLIAAAVGAAGAIGAGVIGANAAEKAASTQAAAANRAADLQQQQYEQSRADAMPWMEAGKKGLDAYLGELGLGSADFQSKFEETPGYKFEIEQGEKGVLGNLNKLGMKNSGAALKALTDFRQGLARKERGTYLDRLAGVSGMGQNQVNQTNALGQQSATNQGNAIMGAGEAQASGYIGGANAWTNAISNFTNTAGRALGRYDNSWNYVGG